MSPYVVIPAATKWRAGIQLDTGFRVKPGMTPPPVMPVPDQVRDDGSGIHGRLLTADPPQQAVMRWEALDFPMPLAGNDVLRCSVAEGMKAERSMLNAESFIIIIN